MRSAKGSVVKLGKDHYRVFVSYLDSEGVRHRPNRTIRGSRIEAEDVKIAMLIEVDKGYIDSSLTIRGYVANVYLPYMRGCRKAKTVQTAEDRCRRYITPLEDIRLSDLTPRMIREWLATYANPKTRFVAYVTLRQVLNHAAKNEVLGISPLSKVDTPEKPKYEPKMLDAEDTAVYLWHYRDTPVEAAVLLVVGGGFRRGEVCAFDWEDINPVTGLIKVDDEIVNLRGKPHKDTPKSGTSTRDTYLPRCIVDRLFELPGPHTGPIIKERGERMHPERITSLYIQRRKRLPEGVPRVPLKNLRHTSLTLAFDSGADLLTVSLRAGHSDTRITSQYYLRPKGKRDAEAAEALDTALRGKTRAKVCQLSPTAPVFEVVYQF
jgi:integrase